MKKEEQEIYKSISLSIETLEQLIDCSFNYERVRVETVKRMSSIDTKYQGISDRYKVIWNPNRYVFFTRSHDIGILKYFDVEAYDLNDESSEEAVYYLYLFVKIFIELYKQPKQLIKYFNS
ncbi:MAG: hypothetical protein N4A45_06880 [Flavobacteriales bacterium]|jgi:hypothetical protein|nr:hypothetical protein [Flavobacteriales bacterium]